MENQNPNENLLAPDAPIVALMSLRGSPLIKDMSTEELTAHLARVKQLAQSAPTLNSQLITESKGGKKESIAAKRKALLADL